MKRGVLALGLLAVALFAWPSESRAGEGWCGGTDTSKCCKKLGQGKGKCSCACVPGNCYCGPRLKAPGGGKSLAPDAALTVIELKDGKVTKKRKMLRRQLPGGRPALSRGAKPPARAPTRMKKPALAAGATKFKPVRGKGQIARSLSMKSGVPAAKRRSLGRSALRARGRGGATRSLECIAGACICKGAASCNNLISVCVEKGYDLGCSEQNKEGQPTGCLCVNKGG